MSYHHGKHYKPVRSSALGPPQEPAWPEYIPFEQGYYQPPGYPQQPSGGLFGGSGAGSGLDWNRLKLAIDRMGGIDGILNTMSKINKMMQMLQQMAPMLRLLMGSFAGGKASTAFSALEEELEAKRRRRRRRKGRRRPARGRRVRISGKSRIRRFYD